MTKPKCGIYKIECVTTGKAYIGSSKRIEKRWSEHRICLRSGNHHTLHLQRAWNRAGEDLFKFSVLEECSADLLEEREQWYVDELKPAFNAVTDIKRRIGPGILEKRAAALRARAQLITHCPLGHPYDEANTYRNKKCKRICRACNALRVSSIYAGEIPEQREARRIRAKLDYEKNREIRLEQMRKRVATHKAEKQEYDRQHRKHQNRLRNERRKNESPERREARLRLKMESYYRNKALKA